MRREPVREVVRVEDRDVRRRGEPVAAHHRDVHPRDRQDAGRAPRRGADRADTRRRTGLGAQRMVRQERREVRAHTDRADARTAAAVRDAERLVQVEVRHVGAELARPRDADERVEVRAVEVHLTAVLVHDRADLADLLLEHAVRRRVRHHQRAEPVGVLDGLAPSGRRGRRCRGRRTRRRRRASRPSPPTPRSCRAPTRG